MFCIKQFFIRRVIQKLLQICKLSDHILHIYRINIQHMNDIKNITIFFSVFRTKYVLHRATNSSEFLRTFPSSSETKRSERKGNPVAKAIFPSIAKRERRSCFAGKARQVVKSAEKSLTRLRVHGGRERLP